MDVGPRAAAVGRAVDVGVRAVDARLLVADLVPRGREHDVGIGLVDGHVDGAGGGALRREDAGPVGPAVFGHEEAAAGQGVVERSLDGDEDPVVVARVDHDLADRVAVLEAHVGPRRAAVGRLVDAVAVVGRAAAVVGLAAADPDDSLRVDFDGAQRLREIVRPDVVQRHAAVGGLPEASAAGCDVDDARRGRIRRFVTEATADVARAELSPHLVGGRRALARLPHRLRL